MSKSVESLSGATMNDKAEEMRAKMKALSFPDDALSNASSSAGYG